MVNIDTVYQRVLVLANKEQRGYITPQEFNLYANQAQMNLFEQYFYDINQFGRGPGNDTEFSNMLDLLNEKISIFEVNDAVVSNGVTLPPNIYRLGTVMFRFGGVHYEAERVGKNEFLNLSSSPLGQPRNTRPVYITDGVNGNGRGLIRVYGHSVTMGGVRQKTMNVTCNYIRRPHNVEWGYVVVNSQAQYNASATVTTHFELHESEETNLVYNILKLAGITIKEGVLYQVAAGEEMKDIQQEKV